MRFLPLVLRSLSPQPAQDDPDRSPASRSVVFVISALLAVEGGFETLFDSSEPALLNVSEKGLACPFASRVFDSYLPMVASVPHVVDATGVLRGLYSYQTRDKLVVVSGVDYEVFRKLKSVVGAGGQRSRHSRDRRRRARRLARGARLRLAGGADGRAS